MYILMGIVATLAVVLFVGWLGLQVQPAPFPDYPQVGATDIETVPLRTGLPKPVERFFRQTYGDRVPVIETAVMTGRATIRPVGSVNLPARYRFTHVAGQSYRHYIEACWFGIPFLKVNESYLDGTSAIDIPIIGKDSGPKIEQAANLGMWAESWQLPALLVTDPRVRWEPVADDTAWMIVPFKAGKDDRFLVRFDPKSGEPTWSESMRYQKSDSIEKTLWMTHADGYGTLGGHRLNTVGSATWMSDGKPWATFTLEDVRYNVDVAAYVRARGL
jgi:hypothetical protein